MNMMKKTSFIHICSLFFLTSIYAQDSQKDTKNQERNPDKFKQMYDLLATPNMYRTASGAPGPEYYQQQADYKIDVELDDKNQKFLAQFKRFFQESKQAQPTMVHGRNRSRSCGPCHQKSQR